MGSSVLGAGLAGAVLTGLALLTVSCGGGEGVGGTGVGNSRPQIADFWDKPTISSLGFSGTVKAGSGSSDVFGRGGGWEDSDSNVTTSFLVAPGSGVTNTSDSGDGFSDDFALVIDPANGQTQTLLVELSGS